MQISGEKMMAQYRKDFPILEAYTYFNTARFCALPKQVIRIQKRYLEGLAENGSWNFEEWTSNYENARELSAHLIQSKKDNIFFIPNVSTGINLASIYLSKKSVILLEGDFPSVTLPWQTHGFEIESINYKSPDFYEQLEAQLKKGNQIFCVSWVQSMDGFEIDLQRVFQWCKEYDNALVLDGTQGLGALNFKMDPDVSMVFLSSSFKWLISGYGVALGYVSEDLLPRFKAFQGWNSVDFGTGMAKTGAASLEVGNALFLNVLGLNEGLKMILELGVNNIEEKNLTYRDRLIAKLQDTGRSVNFHAGSRSSIFRIETQPGEYEKLEEAAIQTSKQNGFVRLSPHFYNNEKDVERLLSILTSW